MRNQPMPTGRGRTLRPLLLPLLGVLILWNVLLGRTLLQLHMNDFGKLYYSAVFFLNGDGIYQPNPATAIPIGHGRFKEFANLNPPHVLLGVLPLALLSPLTALSVWAAASMLSAGVSVRLICREIGVAVGSFDRVKLAVVLLAFVGTQTTVVTAQASLLLLLPATLAWIQARNRRWVQAGIYIGALVSLKLFFLLFLPYLCARTRIRAAAAMVLTAGAVFGVGLGVFGLGPYLEWIDRLHAVDWSWGSMNGSLAGLLGRSLVVNPHYEPLMSAPVIAGLLWLVVGVVIGALTVWTSTRDETTDGIDRGFALILLGALLTSPLGWVYYTWLALGPMAALWLGGRGLRTMSNSAPRLPRLLTAVGMGALFVPTRLTIALQPSGWMTITLGSVYFWGLLCLWTALVIDQLWGRLQNSPRADCN